MDWDTYKRLCDQPNVWSRWMLEQTIELLGALPAEAAAQQRHTLADNLRGVLQTSPLPRPPDHRGGAFVDMFELALPQTLVELAATSVAAAVAQGIRTPATEQRGLGGFTAAWDEYRNWDA